MGQGWPTGGAMGGQEPARVMKARKPTVAERKVLDVWQAGARVTDSDREILLLGWHIYAWKGQQCDG